MVSNKDALDKSFKIDKKPNYFLTTGDANFLKEDPGRRYFFNNRPPLRCRFGFHKWATVASHVNGDLRKIQIISQCCRAGCRAEKTEVAEFTW